jgi:hypothetical protein
MTTRGSISHEDTLRLWVKAGGRCEYAGCNRFLLEDKLTGFELNLAERAHVVGATRSKGSPRGEAALPLAERDKEANLMLLCRDHHRVIDRLIEEHGVGGLLRMKREHEDRIRLLTSQQEDAASVVIRAIGQVRGSAVDIPRSAVQAALLNERRYPRFPLALAGEDLEIDLRDLPDEGTTGYWEMAERIIASKLAPVAASRQTIPHLSVFALARIPLLVALGYHLDDKISATIYPRRRDGAGDGQWGFNEESEPVEFTVRRAAGRDTGDDVAIALSTTAPITDDVVAAASCGTVYELVPEGRDCGRDLLSSRKSLENFSESYHALLAMIETKHPGCRVIDLYAAVPAPGAIHLGRGVMRDAQPALRIYDRDRAGDFREALVLGAGAPHAAVA